MELQEVASLSDLVEVALSVTAGEPDREWWFRGHGRGSWELVPTLYREEPDVAQAVAVEAQMHVEFDNRSRMVPERSSARDVWELYFLMQHYGLPTRLLDWSRSLLIAAYFAVFDDVGWDCDDPPIIYVFNPGLWNGGAVGALAMASAGPSGIVSDLHATAMAGYQPRVPGQQAGIDGRWAVAIAGPEFAARILAQRGVFTVFGTDASEGGTALASQTPPLEGGGAALVGLRLTGDAETWRRALRLVGIGAFSAFPDLSGLAKELKGRYL